MSIVEAMELAKRLLEEHGLTAQGWRVRMYMNTDKHLGQCVYSKKLIRLHRLGIYLNTREHALDTILHEIAHAKTPGAGHGPAWQEAAKALGATPSPCVDETFVMPPRREQVANRKPFDRTPRLVKRSKAQNPGSPGNGGK